MQPLTRDDCHKIKLNTTKIRVFYSKNQNAYVTNWFLILLKKISLVT